jgi:tetratricopeptide (TPR) repeat protein
VDFVGRAAETNELRAAIERAAAGTGGTWLVAGEAGIGKTRLVEHVVDGAHDAGVDVHWATCWEGEGAPALWPWTQLLRTVLARPDLASPRELVALDDAEDSIDAHALRFRVYDATTGTLLARAVERPLTLVIDDLQWADDASVHLLRFMSRTVRSAPVLLVATVRDTDVEPDSALARELDELVKAGGLLQLGGLNPDELAALVGSLGADPGTMAAALGAQTGGNPFFAREVVQLMRADGRLVAGVPAGRVQVPPTVNAVLNRRLARLAQRTHRVLAAASVIGAEFETAVLAAATGRTPAAVDDELDPARSARLVVDRTSGRVGFAHALVRAALYDGLGAHDRAELHRRVAIALEEAGAGPRRPAELANHLIESAGVGVGDHVDRAIDYAVRAARQAEEVAAFAEAAGWYERAIVVLRTTGQTDTIGAGRLLVDLGEAHLAAGAVDEARRAFLEAASIARATGEPALLASAALGFGAGLSGFEVTLFDRTQIELLEDTLVSLPPGDSPTRVAVLARLSVALSFVGDVARRQRLAEEAVAMARRVGEPVALGRALASLADVISGPDHVGAREKAADEVITLARQVGEARLELLGRRLRVVALLEQGRLGEAEVEIGTYADRVDAVRQPIYAWYVPLWLGMLALARGDIEATARHLDEATAIGERAASENARLLTANQRLYVLRAGGRFEDAGRLLIDVFGPLARANGQHGWFGIAHLMMGRVEEARPLLRQFPEQLVASGRDAEWMAAVAVMGQAAVVLGERAVAATAREWLAPYADQFVVDGIGAAMAGSAHWHVARLAQFLGDDEAAERHDREADVAHRRAGIAGAIPLVGPWPAADPAPTPAARPPERASLSLEGDTWAVEFGGRSVHVRDSKGLRDIAVLLERPGTDVHVVELTSVVLTSAQGPTIDAAAVAAYRSRLADLEEELTEADDHHDVERSARLSRERDFIVAELVGGIGLGGRARRLDDPVERARKAVRARVRDCIDRVIEVDPALGRHLENSVRTGTYCSYRPEQPVTWTVRR